MRVKKLQGAPKSFRGRQKAPGAQEAYKKNRKNSWRPFFFLGDSKNFVLCRGAKNFSRGRRMVNMVNVTPLGPSTKDVRQNLGFSNHLPLSGCVRISKTTSPDFSMFTHFSIFTHFYFFSLKKSLLPNSCFFKFKMLNTITFRK